jgi:hypothetical protein
MEGYQGRNKEGISRKEQTNDTKEGTKEETFATAYETLLRALYNLRTPNTSSGPFFVPIYPYGLNIVC